MKPSTFHYQNVQKVSRWGCNFDSLTELRFAVSVMEEYALLRNWVSIYYHPGTLQPTSYIRRCHRRYTPDFLIRHRETGKAFLVEIKPRAFEHYPQLLLRKEVAQNYIHLKNYDWTFKVVFDDEIILTAEQCEAFEDCRKLKPKSIQDLWLKEYSKRLLIGSSTNKQIEFVMFGKK
ncbi:hypothetical protein QEG73_00845 [Chitinophagaceae bacterium 26-R-25]|nr:hypothetical protein [Chitinophagaceae bacterium 26-R-25]